MAKSTYSDKLADRICEHIAGGKSLRAISKLKNMPSTTTITRWLIEHDYFRAQYAYAREEQADTYADEIVSIADDKKLEADDKRVRIDARKWVAAKLRPKKYGDRLNLDKTINVDVRLIPDADLMKRIADVQKKLKPIKEIEHEPTKV